MFFHRTETWSQFLEQCNANLHIVLCFSSYESFRQVCRIHSGLIGGTVINWIHSWSQNTLATVANMFLAEHPNIPEHYKAGIIEHIVHVHSSLKSLEKQLFKHERRKVSFTPKHYLELINSYLKLIGLWFFCFVIYQLQKPLYVF